MEIIEIFANRRSGHHFFLSWFTSNLIGERDTQTKDLNKITWLNSKAVHINDASYHAFFDFDKTLKEIGTQALKSPDYMFINYEDAGMLPNVSAYFNENEIQTTQVVFIRDFLNMMASKWKASNGLMKEFYFGFEREDIIKDNIRDWKDIAKAYLGGKYARISYEEILTNPEAKVKFLKDNFDKPEIFPSSGVEGTLSSFSSSNFNDRYKEIEFNSLFKDIASSDTELKYLIKEMNYNPIENIL
jgi:hypothetical protein